MYFNNIAYASNIFRLVSHLKASHIFLSYFKRAQNLKTLHRTVCLASAGRCFHRHSCRFGPFEETTHPS